VDREMSVKSIAVNLRILAAYLEDEKKAGAK
jgi:hypothetical protein